MRLIAPGPDDLTPEQILFLRGMRHLPDRVPGNLPDLCDIALSARFPHQERKAARIELARAYAEVVEIVVGVDPLGDLLVELSKWAEVRRFDDDQDPGTDTPDERVVRAYMRWIAIRGIL